MANLCIFNCISLHFSIAKYKQSYVTEVQKVIKLEETEDSIIEYYDLEQNLEKVNDKAKDLKQLQLPNGMEVVSKLNGKDLEAKGLVEKVKKVKNKKTKEETTTYQVTIVSPIKLEDNNRVASTNNLFLVAGESYEDESDPSYSITGYARATFDSKYKGNDKFTRVSKWEAKYVLHDRTVSAKPVVYANGWGETYNGGFVQACTWLGCYADKREVPITSQNVWHSLYPYWSDEYIFESPLFGQEGGFFTTLKRGTSSNWEHRVSFRYGMYDGNS